MLEGSKSSYTRLDFIPALGLASFYCFDKMRQMASPAIAPGLKLDTLVVGDSIHELRSLPSDSVHLILSDIPYGIGVEDWDILHKNTNSAFTGSSPAQEKAGAIFRRRGKPINGWSEADRDIPKQYYDWCLSWSPEWLRILQPGGTPTPRASATPTV